MPKKKNPVDKVASKVVKAVGLKSSPKRRKSTKKTTRKTTKKSIRKRTKKPQYKIYKTKSAAETAKDRQAGTNRIVDVKGGFRVLRTGKSRNKKK